MYDTYGRFVSRYILVQKDACTYMLMYTYMYTCVSIYVSIYILKEIVRENNKDHEQGSILP